MTRPDDQVQIDMGNVTVGEIQRLDNPALKEIMLQVKKQLEDEATGSPERPKNTVHNVFYLSFYNYT
jgi:hypothetical protein